MLLNLRRTILNIMKCKFVPDIRKEYDLSSNQIERYCSLFIVNILETIPGRILFGIVCLET